jgi:hypothetical protein
MSLPEFPQIDLRKRRRRPRAAVPQAQNVRPASPARAHGPRGGRAVCRVASRTRPDIWYTVYIAEGGTLFCARPDFVHRRRHRGEERKHLRGLRSGRPAIPPRGHRPGGDAVHWQPQSIRQTVDCHGHRALEDC